MFGVYTTTGTLLLGSVAIGALWQSFPITDCTDPSRDPIVLYDQLVCRSSRRAGESSTTSGIARRS